MKKSDKGYQAEVTNYLYDRQNVILETDASDNIKARYVKGINYIAKADAAGKESYFLYNGHGDVVQTVDAAGTVQNQYDYDIWGNPTLTVETTNNAIRYTGEFYDEETGLYYLRARYYDPYLGRFTTEDSYWGEADSPLSLNLYTYCENDPIQYTDPTGHLSEWNKQNLSKEQQKQVEQCGKDYYEALAKGDRAGMDRAHNNAEAVRNQNRNENEYGTVDGNTLTKPSSGGGSSSSSGSSGKSSGSSSSSSSGSSNKTTTEQPKQSPKPKEMEESSLSTKGVNVQNPNSSFSSFFVNLLNENDLVAFSPDTFPKTTTSTVNKTTLIVDGQPINCSVFCGEILADPMEVAKAIYQDYTKYELAGKQIQLPKGKANIKEIAKALKVEDTLSIWEDKDGKHAVIQSDMKNQAVQVTRTGDTIKVVAYADIQGDAEYDKFENGKTYHELAVNGFKLWNGDYIVDGRKVIVNVHIIDRDKNEEKDVNGNPYNPGQQWLTVNIVNGEFNPGSNVDTGIDNNGKFKEWGVNNTGIMTLNMAEINGFSNGVKPATTLAIVAAHEFGHVLGIDDTYRDDNKKRDEAKVTSEVPYYDMMRSGTVINNKKTSDKFIYN